MLFIKVLILFLLIIVGLITFPQYRDIIFFILGLFISNIYKEQINIKNFNLFTRSKILYRNKYIRLSISYLYRIKVKDKYFLIKGKRIKNQFQPVGGVIKWMPEAKQKLEKLEVKNDNNVPIKDSDINDLRIRVKGKYLYEFLKWFKSGKGRENTAFREFYEELIKPGILTHKNFTYINYRYIRRHQTNIRYSKHFQCPELLIAEIYELIPGKKQEKELKQLIDKKNNNYIWLRGDKIKNLKKDKSTGFKISETTKWIL